MNDSQVYLVYNVHILSSVASSFGRVVLSKKHIQHIVKLVLHSPMFTYQLEDLRSVCQARDIEGGLAGGLIGLLVCPYSRHHMDTFESFPFV